MIARIADWSSANWNVRCRGVAVFGPPQCPLRWRIRNLREKCRRARPSGASGTNAEAVLGPARFQ
eukprot:8314520-Alexandrium_andersonii.AAC.1